MKTPQVKIAVFGSGSGSNAEKIMEYFQDHEKIRVAAIFSNSPDAFILKRAAKFQVPSFTFSRQDLYNSEEVLKKLKEHQIDWVILAGFMWLVPSSLVKAYPDRIINIHPALLPKFGGKGMYGDHVHKAVIEAKETESGITIHLIDEEYDKGKTLFQQKCTLTPEDSPQTLAGKVRQLEHTCYPRVIEETILKVLNKK